MIVSKWLSYIQDDRNLFLTSNFVPIRKIEFTKFFYRVIFIISRLSFKGKRIQKKDNLCII